MKRIATAGAMLAIAVPGTAVAAGSSSTCQAYNPQLCSSVQKLGPDASHGGATSAGSATSAGANSSGTLPFTGIDVALLAAGGGGLLGAGLVVRRLSSRLD